jgi:hypothetical protein
MENIHDVTRLKLRAATQTKSVLLNRTDAIIVMRTGLSESGAFELAYNIFGGAAAPIFFAIWEQAPLKTTLLRALPDFVPVRYVTFGQPEELRRPLLEFLRACAHDQSRNSSGGNLALSTAQRTGRR